MKILITGGMGFIGSYLTEKYLKSGHSVYIIDDISYHPLTQTEISTITYEYPSKMFIDYLTLEEVYQFMITGDGFEFFNWRGKEYRTQDLKNIF